MLQQVRWPDELQRMAARHSLIDEDSDRVRDDDDSRRLMNG